MPPKKTEQNLKLLLIDDDENIHLSVGDFLQRTGYQVEHAYSGEEGLDVFLQEGADIVITDIKMPDLDGIALLHRLKQNNSDVEVILITGHGDLDIAIAALRQGAFDFFNKPVKMEELITSLERTQRYQAMRRERDRMRQRLEVLMRSGEGAGREFEIIGNSPAMQEVMQLVDKVAPVDHTTVLITGESGTGKELIARAIHQYSSRAQHSFATLNSAAIPDNLVENELFGHEKGAFTDARATQKGLFELSDGGTLFLDEIGEMGQSAQAKILRVLEDHKIRRVGGGREIPIDVRLVAATNKDLEKLQEEGQFRQDLYYRLNVFTIHLPPLRERAGDVVHLARYYLRRFTQKFRKEQIVDIAPEALQFFRQYSFPGNVRELCNLLERAIILCEGTTLTMQDFAIPNHFKAQPTALPVANQAPTTGHANSSLTLNEIEKNAIIETLKRTDNNQTEAARSLGIGYSALRYRIRKYDLD